MFQSIGLKVNVRALNYREPFLFTGVGSLLSIYRLTHRGHFELIKHFELNIKGSIIGINIIQSVELDELDDNNIIDLLIHSTRHIVKCSLRLFTNEHSFDCTIKHCFQDNLNHWIIDCAVFFKWLFILNSRNEVIIYDLNKQSIQYRLSALQKCILYSGRFIQISTDGVVIASGNVFKQIFIWAIRFDSDDFYNEKNISIIDLETLSGHDGVLFSIHYDPITNILISCSDDRTIRLWQGSQSSSMKTFCLNYWQMNHFTLSHTYYGHNARIWKVMSCYYDNNHLAISAGEDAMLIVWSLLPPYRMIKKLSTLKNNKIWTFEITKEEIVLGGSSGSIQSLPLNDLLECNDFSLKKQMVQIHKPKTVILLRNKGDNQNSFFITSTGKLKHFPENNDVKLFVDDQNIDEILSNHVCSDVNNDRTKLIIATKCGCLALFQYSTTFELLVIEKFFNEKIFSVYFVSEDKLIVGLREGIVHVVMINETNLRIMNEWNVTLLPSRHRLVSCGHYIIDLLILGDSSGSITMHKANESKPLWTFANIHGYNGITSLKQKPKTNLFYASCRDSRITEFIYEIDSHGHVIDFILLRTFLFLSSMEWIAGFEFDDEANLKYVYGFESTRFQLWDLNGRRIIFEEECGGGHRSWNFLIDQRQMESYCQFIYIKQDNVVNVQRKLLNCSKPTQATYCSIPRKINCCTFLTQSNDKSYSLVAGEENYIQLIEYCTKSNCFNLKTTLYGHISNIMVMKTLELNQDNIFAISAGGRAQIVIWKFWKTAANHQLLIQERCSNFLGMFDQHLKFEDRIRRFRTKNATDHYDIRYLDLDFISYSKDNTQLLILVSCSDSAYRVMFYEDNERRLTTLKRISLGTSCIQIIKFVKELSTNCCHSFHNMFTLASNDGHFYLCSFRFDENVFDADVILTEKLHESGINSVDLKIIDDQLLMITGGDNNTVNLNIITQQSDLKLKLIVYGDNSMHTCQVTGLCFINENHFISTSIDQKVIAWEWNNEKLTIKPLKTFQTSVTDVSCLAQIPTHSRSIVLVCGDGFQLIEMGLL